ncbi:MAG: ABC transporter ATP-binding protein [Anaerolineae bacterium]|nr:ABC transporter ATP-binding protein [Anaerolineae bacterium]
MINIKGLSKFYGKGGSSVRALNEVNLCIEEGMFGLLGPNGAGKTSLMRILAGIIQPTGGHFSVGGKTIEDESGRTWLKKTLGYLPQELGLYPDLSARQFVDYMGVLKGMDDDRQRHQRVGEVLEMVGLSEAADRKLKGFSGGMKRRVGIAQALVNDPRILIVDEPTAGLDPEERIRFRNLLVNLAVNRVVILSTHIVEDISQTCLDMAILAKGQVIFHDTPAMLIKSAEGHVWSLQNGTHYQPDPQWTIVSMLHLAEGISYRLVGPAAPDGLNYQAVQPGLEDGYVWLMKNHNLSESL